MCEVLTSHSSVVLNGMRCRLWRNANCLLSAVKGFALERLLIDCVERKLKHHSKLVFCIRILYW